MMDVPAHQGCVSLLQGKRFFRKWRRYYGIVYAESRSGLARLELYSSDAQFHNAAPKTIMVLSECILIRILTIEKNQLVIQIQLRDLPMQMISVGNAEQWHYHLCKAAFPHKFVTIGNHHSCSSPDSSPLSENASILFLKQFPVLLIFSNGAVLEGNYDITFEESGLLLTNALHISAFVLYSTLQRVGVGYSCLGLETASKCRLEFRTTRPQELFEGIEQFVVFSQTNTFPLNWRNRYDSFYVAQGLKERESSSSVQACTERNEVHSAQTKNKTKKNPSKIKKFSRFFFFRKTEKEPHDDRDCFEQSADDEWIHYRISEDHSSPCQTSKVGIDNAWQLELANRTSDNKAKHGKLKCTVRERLPDVPEECPEQVEYFDDAVAGMGARIRDSIASEPCSTPFTQATFGLFDLTR